jgi:hypothetical protein
MFSFSAMMLQVFGAASLRRCKSSVSKGRVPSLPKFVKPSKQPLCTNWKAGTRAKPVPLSGLGS